MRLIYVMIKVLFMIIVLPKAGHAQTIWVSEENFGEKPNYLSVSELGELEGRKYCEGGKDCDTVRVGKSKFYKTIIVNETNFKEVLIGTWTGGECSSDFWTLRDDLTLNGQYPNQTATYSWWGTYDFKAEIYSEKMYENKEEKNLETNTVLLFYIPILKRVIYKAIQANSTDEIENSFYFSSC